MTYWEDLDQWVHVDNVPNIKYAQERLQMILECLYGKRKFSELEEHLEELCAELEMKNLNADLAVREKRNEYFEIGAFLSTANL